MITQAKPYELDSRPSSTSIKCRSDFKLLGHALQLAAFLIFLLPSMGVIAQESPVRLDLDDTLSSQILSDRHIQYFFEDHDAEQLISPRMIREKALPMIGLSRSEQAAYFEKLIPELLSHSYLNIDKVSNKAFKSKLTEPLEDFVSWKYVWYKFKLSYHGQNQQKRVIIKPGFGCDYCYLYSADASGHVNLEGYTGRIVPHSDREYSYTGNFFNTILQKNEEKTYFLLFRAQYTMLQPEILSTEEFNDQSTVQIVLETCIYGAGIFAIFYYSFLGFYSKDQSYINFTYLIINFLAFLSTTQSLTKLMSLFSVFVAFPDLTIVIHLSLYICVARFMLSYLQAQRLPKVNQIGQSLILISSLVCLGMVPLNQLGLINVFWFFTIFIVIALTIVSFSSLLMLYFSYKKERTGYIFTAVGSTVAAAVMSTYILYFLGQGDIFWASHFNLVRVTFFLGISVFAFDMGTRLKIANEQLQLHIHHVEELVAQKTAEILSIMNNIKVGIFAVEDADVMKISAQYSKELEEILETSDISGESAREIFLNKLDLDSDSRSQVESFLSASLHQDSLSFEVNEHLAPTSLRLNTRKGKKYLNVDWGAVIIDDIVEKMIISIKDVTRGKAFEEEASKAKRELDIIDKILQVDPHIFNKFMLNAADFIANNKSLISGNHSNNPEVVKILFMNMHTLKGSARSYNFTHMTGCIHDIEQSYALLQRHEKQWDQEELLAELTVLEGLIQEYEDISLVKLGRKVEASSTKVDRLMVKSVIDLVEGLPEKNANHQKISEYYSQIYYTETLDVLNESLKQIPSLARDLGKAEPNIILEGDPSKIDNDGADILQKSLVHIIRNSMDHGVEGATERESSGKPPEGKIFIKTMMGPQGLKIVFSDDGRGLNLSKIRELGRQRNLIREDRDYSKEEIAALILKSGFSTASAVTEISGRGVGMDAVKTFLEGAGGSLTIKLNEQDRRTGNYLFDLILELPYQFFSKSA